MIITCPKCGTSFKIHDDVVSDYGRNMRCSTCGEVWMVKKEAKVLKEEVELTIAEPQEEDKIEPTFDRPEKTSAEDFGDIYSRLSAKSEAIDEEYEKMSAFRKFIISFKKKTGLDSRFNRILFYLAFLGLIALGTLYFRFDIVRLYPSTAKYYELMGIKVVTVGYGLEFRNITRGEVEISGKNLITIKGFIYNKTEHNLTLPKLLVQMFDSKGDLIKDFSFEMNNSEVASKNQLPFDVFVEKQKAFVKYIIITFTE
ncbi:MAG: zinc-ribbon domain-containing protein [Alphaproteobacteria bacterium]|nr:zinc-ribbon domain-containing protein [Alphaproteobacteria bacterium]